MYNIFNFCLKLISIVFCIMLECIKFINGRPNLLIWEKNVKYSPIYLIVVTQSLMKKNIGRKYYSLNNFSKNYADVKMDANKIIPDNMVTVRWPWKIISIYLGINQSQSSIFGRLNSNVEMNQSHTKRIACINFQEFGALYI